MRIMGLDVGQKRIGIAFSDELGWTAQGHSVLTRSNLQQDLKHLAGLCTANGVGAVVVGFPRNMNGTVGPKGQEILEFGKLLQDHLGLPIEYWDERLTTVAAQRVLLEANITRRKRKQVVDKLAAVHILQGYLDRQSHK